jgi:hypothetical protein
MRVHMSVKMFKHEWKQLKHALNHEYKDKCEKYY